MKVVPIETVGLSLTGLAEMAKQGPVILTRKGKPLASVKDLSGCDWESVSLANNPQFIALIEKSRRAYREKGGIPINELRKRLGLKPHRRHNKKGPRRENGGS